METKHTPGPWKSFELRKMVSKTTEIFSGDPLTTDPIIRILHNENSIKESEANAKLIAAAPDLLEAAIKAKEYLEFIDTPLQDAIVTAPRTLIEFLNVTIQKAAS